MPKTKVVFFMEEGGRVPVLEKMTDWAARDMRIVAKCFERIEALRERGHEIRRPDADYLRDGIYELRATYSGVNYRLLFFFCTQTGVIAVALTKEGVVPNREIEIAIRYKQRFESDPKAHTYVEDE
ncbi:MAG: type II toxin-antitoxin system RelE/ParE family toxin [Chthonomonadales bacterium]